MQMISASTPDTSPAEPLVRRIATLLGWISLFATLALLSPGVVATASADETAAAGPSCQMREQNDETSALELEQMMERLRDAATDREPVNGVVSLNTRGYNYPRSSAPPAADAAPRDRQ
jgi:hypothetical protein